MGAYSFQFSGNNNSYNFDPNSTITFSANDGHLYHQAENGNKYGAYFSTVGYYIGDTIYGVEAMVAVGPADVEIYGGLLSYRGFDVGLAGAEVFYEIAPDIEVSAGYDTVSETGGSFIQMDVYSLGASYDIPNTNFTATASYETLYGRDTEMYGIGGQWNFGPNQNNCLFGDRDFPFLFGPS